ncbi:tyrosine-type recombinase/integrase [Roseiconus nitratireducens]|nr:tyrosine-type recombinase/integrase [Roseiconus nitratireducens]
MSRYFVHLRMNNWSPRTIDRRSHSVGRFISWCGQRGIGTIAEITTESVEAYRRSLYHHRNERTGKPIRFSTRASYLSAIRHWLGWLCEQGWIEANPAALIELPKEEIRLPAAYLTLEQVEMLLGSVDLQTPAGLRDRAILETFYSTAIRRSELIALKLDDFNREQLLVTIRQGKGRKDRIVPIGKRAMQWIEKYLSDARPQLVHDDSETVFVTTRGNPFHPSNLTALVRCYLTGIGITKRGSCHMLRHTAATLMLEGDADLRSLQCMLGHKCLNTTQVYTHLTIKRLREVHRKSHPGYADREPEDRGGQSGEHPPESGR